MQQQKTITADTDLSGDRSLSQALALQPENHIECIPRSVGIREYFRCRHMEGDRLFGLLHCETTIIFRIIEEQSVFLIIKQIFSIIKTEFNLCRIDVITQR